MPDELNAAVALNFVLIGLALTYLGPQPRAGSLVVSASSATPIAAVQRTGRDLGILDRG